MDDLVTTQWLANNLGTADLAIVDCSAFMPADGRDGGARHAELWKTQEPKNQDGIEHDVEHRARDLNEHDIQVFPLGLQDALAVDLHE